MNKNKILLIAIAGLFSANVAAAEQCEANFSEEGSFFSGKTFKTWADIKGTSYGKAYKKVYQHITKDGWKITSADKEMGIISASQDVSYGDGKTVPYNVVIEDNKPTIKISISYALSGGVISPTDAVLKSFCQTIASAKP